MKTNHKNRIDINLRHIINYTVLCVVATIAVIFLLDNNMLGNDTNALLNRADNFKTLLEANPQTPLPQEVQILPASTQSAATDTIHAGASFSRSQTSQSLTLLVPIATDGTITGYLQLTGQRTPTFFMNFVIISLVVIFYLFQLYRLLRRAINLRAYTDNTVAKIRNIERSPMSQSYLIVKEDDRITTALNQLGESIQRQINSSTQAKQNLYEFIEYFSFPIFVYDGKGGIHRINAAFENEFSRAKGIDTFSPYPDFLKFLVDKMMRPDIQEKTFYFEAIHSYYQVHFYPLDGIRNRYLVIMTDVTEYKQMLAAHNDFIANVSHEFKTPLASIRGFADILGEGTVNPAETVRYAGKISQESKRLMALVTDTLELTKPTIKRHQKNVSLSSLISAILDDYQSQISEHGLKIQTELADIVLKSDGNLLHEIFKNLIENAVFYTPISGEIDIQLRYSEKHLVFSIKNSGKGLSAMEQIRIFERFYRTDSGLNSNKLGTGLGLAIAQKNVTELGGRIRVESETGKSTTFTVQI